MADELCLSATCKFNNNNSFIPTVFFNDLSFLCSIIISHPLYFSCFIFFSPFLFKFIFFISPLFFTTSLLLILSITATTYPQSKLGFIQAVVDEIRSKMNNVHEEEEYEFREFEDFEIYKIVFRDAPLLLTVGDCEGEGKQVSVMENVVRVTGSEEEKRLESLFEELDRFEDYSEVIEMTKNESISNAEEVAAELQKLEPISVKINPCRLDSSSSFRTDESIADSSMAIEKNENENETKSCIKKAVEELQKLEITKNESRSNDEEVDAELQKLEPISVKINPCRLDSSTSFRNGGSIGDSSMAIKKNEKENENENETRSCIKKVVEELQKLEPVKVTSSMEEQKTVQNSVSVKSKPTRSHVLGVIQKFETVALSVSSEEQKSIQNSFSLKSNSWRSDSSSSFGSYGSMRKEKEWKRTLACKLFEERHNSGNEEGMDSLWESYEEDNSSRRSQNKNQKKMVTKQKKKSEFKCFDDGEEDEEEDDDEFMSNGQLCCLKALKLSTGKMNLGMGKPNLVKISKVLKGFGWLHHVGSKHVKKN